MKIIIKLFTISMVLGIVNQVQGQTTDDALRFAIYQPMGTARSMGIGNAISSLGGDFYTMSLNPAGLATYRSSEFVFSQGVQSTKNSSSLNGMVANDELDLDYMMTNVGMVIAHTQYDSKWKSVNFGIGYNRYTNFDSQIFYSGNTEGSITDLWFEEYENNEDLLPYGAGLASNADVFVTTGNGDVSTDYILDGRGELPKNETITSEGGAGEMTIGFAANYNHKLFMGLTIGIPIVSYEVNRFYEEEQDEISENIYFNQLQYEERLEQSGSGINAKLGLIYRVNQAVRLSGYFHTPTVISILDEFSNNLTYRYFDGDRNLVRATASYPPEGEGSLNFEYQVLTPLRVGGGAAFVIGKNGFISAEVGYTDYRQTRFDFDADLSTSEDLEYERTLNASIDERYSQAINLNVGGELALDIFRLRLGAIMAQSPFANDSGFNTTLTTGVGFRINKFFVDVAYRRGTQESSYTPYLTAEQDIYPVQDVDIKRVDHDIFLTLGIKF